MSDPSDSPQFADFEEPPPQRFTEAPPERSFRWGLLMTIVWSLVIALVTLVTTLGVGIGIGVVAMVEEVGDPAVLEPEAVAEFFMGKLVEHLPLLTVVQAVTIIVMVLLLTWPRGSLTRAQMLGLERIGVGKCLAWAFGGLLVLIVLTEIPQLLIDMGQQEAMEWMNVLQPVWLGLVLLVIFAPLSEELLFRGFIYGGLAQSRIGPIGAILITSAIWTVIHVQYTWIIMTQIFIYGVVFGVVRWKSGSLWPSMVAHGVVNLIAGAVFYSGVLGD